MTAKPVRRRARHSKTSRATAGVSLATVDRVVNRREGVREKTIARVEAAVAKLGYRADPAATRLARNQSFRFAFILPTGSNSFMIEPDRTGRSARRTGWPASAPSSTSCMSTCSIRTRWPAALEQLSPAYHGVATVALDHARVRAAIDDLAARGVAVVTLVSDAPNCAPHALCRHRQSRRRPHRGDADGPLPVGAQGARSA